MAWPMQSDPISITISRHVRTGGAGGPDVPFD